jgi:hypothetical protein
VKGYLSQRGIAYTVRDIATDPAAVDELSNLGYMTTPVTTVDGQIVIGFDQKRLDALLESS